MPTSTLDYKLNVTNKNRFKKNIVALTFCKNGYYFLTIIINTKLLHDLKSIKHKQLLFYVYTCPVVISIAQI